MACWRIACLRHRARRGAGRRPRVPVMERCVMCVTVTRLASEKVSAPVHPEDSHSQGVAEFKRRAPVVLASGMTEVEAIARAQTGEEASFEALYNQHKGRVYSLCLRMTGDRSRAEDLTQEAFLRLYRKIGSFRGESAFTTWLHRLTVNIVLMALRKRGLPETSLEESLEPQYEDGPVREIGTADQVLRGSLDRITMERAIAALPVGYRIVFVLHDIEGYEHHEIAQILGCSMGNSKSQLHKARMKLRGLLRIRAKENTTTLAQVA